MIVPSLAPLFRCTSLPPGTGSTFGHGQLHACSCQAASFAQEPSTRWGQGLSVMWRDEGEEEDLGEMIMHPPLSSPTLTRTPENPCLFLAGLNDLASATLSAVFSLLKRFFPPNPYLES